MDIDIRDDSVAEGPEQFFVSLVGSGSQITIQSPSTATVTIIDDGDGMCIYIWLMQGRKDIVCLPIVSLWTQHLS